MYIMGIHDGHNSGATLIKDGKVLASVCEERLTRVKNEVGFPKNSIREILALENLTIENIDHFVFASEYNHSNEKLKNKNKIFKKLFDDCSSLKTSEIIFPFSSLSIIICFLG